MLACKQREDAIGLADQLEYALPVALSDPSLSPALLVIDVLFDIQRCAQLVEDPDANDDPRSMIEALLAHHPKITGLVDLPVYLLMGQEKYDDASCLLRKAIDLGSAGPVSLYLLSTVSARLGQWQRAEENMLSAYEHCRYLRDGFVSLAKISADQGDWIRALQQARRDQQHNRLTPRGRLQLALAEMHNDHQTQAIGLVEEAYASDPDLRDGFATIAWSYDIPPPMVPAGSLALIEKDEQLKRLSAQGMLLSSKYLIWARRFADAERLVDCAYQTDSLAQDGFNRIAVAALMIGEDDRAMQYWQKERDLGRESALSKARFDFMVRPEWQPGDRHVYLYRVYETLPFEKILDRLAHLHNLLGDDVIIEVPPQSVEAVVRKCPKWTIIDGTIFGTRPLPANTYETVPRLSLDKLVRSVDHTEDPREFHIR
jgi:tetratricopeptide (TPR) repeat protein